MKNPSKRYCAREKECCQYRFLSEPARLRSTSKSEICEPCQRHEAQKPERGAASLALGRQQSDEGAQQKGLRIHKAQRFKRDLVLQLFTRRGPFWTKIEQMRQIYDVNAITRLPPPASRMHRTEWDRERESALWRMAVHSLVIEMVPERYYFRLDDWAIFLSACVLYDPPDTQLLEFAAYSDPQPIGVALEDTGLDSQQGHTHIFGLPAVSNVADPEEAAEIERWFYRTVIERIGRRFLEPIGLSIWDMYDEVEDNELLGEYMDRIAHTPTRPYIYLDEHTTEDEIREAFRAFRVLSQEGTLEARKPPRDQLVAVQCAVLADNHRWTQNQIAHHFGWKSKDRVRDHVKLGRKVLGAYTT